MAKRRNTRLEAEGAEFLVVGWLLVNGYWLMESKHIKPIRKCQVMT